MAVDRPPSVTKAIKDVVILEDAAWKFKLPSDTFQDPDGDDLVYSAKLASGVALPSWLRFNADTQTFAGTPPQDFNGALNLQVTASDGTLAASDTFTLTVQAVNDAPTVAQPIPNQAVSEQKPWTFVVPVGTFKDVDSPQLGYTASLGSGVALPSWLSF